MGNFANKTELEKQIGYLKVSASKYQDWDNDFWELVNEGWLSLHGKPIEFWSQGSKWSMAQYKMMKHMQRHRRNRKSEIVSLENIDDIEHIERDIVCERDYLAKVLRSLDGKDRKFIYYRYIRSMSLSEIGKIYGINRAAVCMRNTAIIKKIRLVA